MPILPKIVFFPVLRSLLLVLGLSLFSSCGGSKKSAPAPVPSIRNGQTVISAELQFQDLRPRMADDGKKLVFLSGRSGKTHRVFKIDLAEASAAPTRLTADDSLATEFTGEISPNGSWVAMEGSKGGQRDLFLQAFSGGVVVALTNDAAIDTDVSFSPDSLLYAFIKRSGARTPGRIYVGEISGDGSVAKNAPIGAETDVASSLFWVPTTGGGYTLVTATTTGILSTWTKRAFSTWEEAKTAAATPWVQNLSAVSGSTVAVSSSQVGYLKAVKPVGSKLVSEAGSNPSPDKTYVVKSEPAFVSVAAAQETLLAKPIALDVVSLSLTGDGTTVLMLGRESVRCVLTEAPALRTTMFLGKVDSSSLSRLIPKSTATAGQWELLSDPCSSTLLADGVTTATLDGTVREAAINRNATDTEYSVVFVTHASGDPEIRMLQKTAEATKFIEISANPKK